tara:strand:+ start:299 stop:1237 length:939 start_codon:yes stop_codon:yes gene_type:complete
MDEVFSTEQLPRERRYNAWRDAICDCYVHVDVTATHPQDYRGFIRQAAFGNIVLTDVLASQQSIRRNARHISQLEKDCYYLQFILQGNLLVHQRGQSHVSNAARGTMFYATEQYELQGRDEVRSFYLELPRADFAERFPKQSVPVSASFDSSRGMGRIATEFCTMLASESDGLDSGARRQLGNQLMDMLAITLQSSNEDTPVLDGSVRQARLRSVKLWIEDRLTDPDLDLDEIAAANGISRRYLHQLFKLEEMTVSQWIWDRRLQRCYAELAKRDGRLITSIAYENGFNSSAHFSTMFRKKYGVSPRESLAI